MNQRIRIRIQRIPVAALIAALAALSTACSSLGPCFLYPCPRLDVRNGKDCREVFAVNRDNVAKTFSLRLYEWDGPHVTGTSYLLGPREELLLGCVPECRLRPDEQLIEGHSPQCSLAPDQEPLLGCSTYFPSQECWYEIFDAKDAVPSRESP
jgi:hypothetical protein